MLCIDKKNNYITIDSFPVEGMSFEQIEEAHSKLNLMFSSAIKSLRIDLKNITSNNYSVLTFLICCGEQCVKNKVTIEFINLEEDEFKEILKKMGFDLNGNFLLKAYRKEKPKATFETIGDNVFKIFGDLKKLIGFTGETYIALFYLIKNPRKINFREVLFYMDKSGADAVPIVILVCFLIGLILAYQGIAQMARFGLEVYVADLVSLSLVRELGPLMVGMICIGRAGSAYAAELGTMKVSEEIDAMNTMGVKPTRFLVIPKIVALIIVMPMLVILGDIAGIIGGVCIGTTMSSVSLIQYTNRTLAALVPANILETIIKGIAFAFIIAAVGCFRGFEADNNAKGVGQATTSAVVSGIFLVVIMDFFITFTFPQVMHLFGVNY
jgi:phospholipid/cholesterol/gamma-HCH transport system permease protein